jgi:hypothetical protein
MALRVRQRRCTVMKPHTGAAQIEEKRRSVLAPVGRIQAGQSTCRASVISSALELLFIFSAGPELKLIER